jgi:hypothetical protein
MRGRNVTDALVGRDGSPSLRFGRVQRPSTWLAKSEEVKEVSSLNQSARASTASPPCWPMKATTQVEGRE